MSTFTIKHTRGPWEAVYDDGRAYGTIFADERAIRVATVNSTPGQMNVGHNTRRIVACVNACEGIADPQAMRTALGEAVRYVYEKMPMGEDRDMLAAILRRADNG